jgi:eukaryotic-like serine/threonine-protein kinase
VRLDTGERKIVLEGGFGARYLPTGHLIFGRGDSLFIVPFDPVKLQTHGDPIQVVDQVGNSTAGTLEYAFSENGTLVTFPPGLTHDEGGFPIMLNRKGEKIPFANGAFDSIIMDFPRISPDDRKLAADNKFEIWSYDLLRGTATRLTSGPRSAWPIWSPDNKRVTYASEQNGLWNPFWRTADGSSEQTAILRSDSTATPMGWSPDGTKLLLYSDNPETSTDILIYDTISKKLSNFAATPALEWDGSFSPDGKWVVYTSDESGTTEVYVRSFQGAPGRWQVSTNGGANPRWKMPNEIIYQQGEKVMSVALQTSPSFSAGTPQLLFEGRYPQMDVTSDHQRFIAILPKQKGQQEFLNVTVNWFNELRHLPR